MEIQEANKLWGISAKPLEKGSRVQLGIPDFSHRSLSRRTAICLAYDTPNWSVLG
jgi:hypothetical protein